jgi:hypothetical protein
VYILVELPKLLELGKDSKRFAAVTFFCHWAVHVLLTYEGARRLVRRFNRVQMIDYEAKQQSIEINQRVDFAPVTGKTWTSSDQKS